MPLERSAPPFAPRSLRRRSRAPDPDLGVAVREEEKRLLALLGKFRVISLPDLARNVYGGDERAVRADLLYLERRRLVELAHIPRRRDRLWSRVEPIEVVTLSRPAKKILRQSGTIEPDQPIYAGPAKPRQAEHDSFIYPACLKEMERISAAGGKNPRVRLEFEIKGALQRALAAERAADRQRGLPQIKRQLAEEFKLPYAGGRILIPDARLEYEQQPGSTIASSDIEIVTSAYGTACLRAKARAEFRLYACARDRAHLGPEIEGEDHCLHPILEL
jgi:hypothetical protein